MRRRLLRSSANSPAELFRVMAFGGRVGFETVLAASTLDWSEVDTVDRRDAVRARPRSRQSAPSSSGLSRRPRSLRSSNVRKPSGGTGRSSTGCAGSRCSTRPALFGDRPPSVQPAGSRRTSRTRVSGRSRPVGRGTIFARASSRATGPAATALREVVAPSGADLPPSTCCHTLRTTGITAYLSNGGTIEHAQRIARHASPKTTKLYDRTADTISADEIERIVI